METVSDFIFGGSKITADGDCSHEIKRCLLLGTKVMSNLDSIFKREDLDHGVVATEVGSLSLLQQISLTQALNRSLLHGRGILYQLSYQGNPMHVLFS